MIEGNDKSIGVGGMLTTRSGCFYYNKPVIVIEDVAQALSRTPRFLGHTKRFYSVAEHSYHCSFVGKTNLFEKLMHDVQEAYICDVPSPLKKLLGAKYRNIEAKIVAAIRKQFDLKYNARVLLDVHKADMQLLSDEAWAFSYHPDVWTQKLPKRRLNWQPQYWSMDEAYNNFLDRFYDLY